MSVDEMPSGNQKSSWYADPPPNDYESPELPPYCNGKFVALPSMEMVILFCDNGDMIWIHPDIARTAWFKGVFQPTLKGFPDE